MDIIKLERSLPKHIAYGKSTKENELQINWKKVNILTNDKNNANQFEINPYDNINYVTQSTILGCLTTAYSKIDIDVNDRPNKERQTWDITNKSLYLRKT